MDQPWQQQSTANITSAQADSTIAIDITKTDQAIEGFGTCFNEQGWASLSALDKNQRTSVMKELFSKEGGNLTYNRMPLGANDFALEYYSLDDTDGDFAMKDFNTREDEKTLIPFIKAALAVNPDLYLWASPWTPPAWMKVNKHYACHPESSWNTMIENFKASMNGKPDDNPLRFRLETMKNGLSTEGLVKEGQDGFIQKPEYLQAYADYFAKFVDAYKAKGIKISMVMPQNEFNSNQCYPSCTWKAASLANFIGKYLGPAMQRKGVDVFFGTVERANPALTDTVLNDADAKKYVKGVSFQWAGKDALPKIRKEHPGLFYVQSEQECGNGLNNWEGAMHSWDLMKQYIGNGVRAYCYWNTSLFENKASRWGWYQNSLVTVNDTTKEYKFTPEYYVLKHTSHYLSKDDKRLITSGTFSDAMAYLTANGTVIVIAVNKTASPMKVSILLKGKTYTANLPALSINSMIAK
jgi:glucosylceramidase